MASLHKFVATLTCGLAAACTRQPSQAESGIQNTGSPAEQIAQPPPILPGGLQPAEAASISAEASAFLRGKRFDSISERLHWSQRPGACGSHFDVGNGQIVDASLGPQSGRVQVVVPITPTTPVQAYNGRPVYPGLTCFGVQRDAWIAGQTRPVTFQFNVERWQTGWRLAQLQGR